MTRLPPPIWTAIYLLVAGAISAAYPFRVMADLRVLWLGVLLIAAGVAIAASAVVLFRREGTDLDPMSETNKLVIVRGPHRFTRNPMYLGLTLLSAGIAFCVGSLPMFAVPLLVFATANWAHIPYEEAKMRRQFGASFDAYTRRVRRWL